jgi:hypothetical protein
MKPLWCKNQENPSDQISHAWAPLKGQCHEIFNLWFLHESVSPKPLSIQIGPFQIVSKIRGEIFAAQGAPPVSLTPVANGKKS